MNEPTTKQCPLCRELVQSDARKCPHCHHFLNKRTLALYHPLVGASPILLMLAGAIYLLAHVFNRGENFEQYKAQVQVVDPQIEFGQNSKGEETVAVVGTIRNDSPVVWKEVQVETQFMDSARKVFDVKSTYGLPNALPAHDSCAFKLSQTREFPKEHYQALSARVLWARDARAWP